MKNLEKVEISMENINKCLCKAFPLRMDNKCSKDKMNVLNKKLKQKGNIKDISKPEEVTVG